MSVNSFKEDNQQRPGEETYRPDGTTVSTYSRNWLALTTSHADNAKTILDYGSAPKIGASHNTHAAARCINRGAAPVSHETKKAWRFTARYSTEFDIRENPLGDPAKTQWSTETFQAVVSEDIHGDAILNSAGDPFDPPAYKDDSRWTSITRKNVANKVPDWIFAYQDGVNSDSYTIDGKLIAAGEAKISAIHLGETQERNEIDYRVLTITMHYRGEGDDAGSSGYGSGSGADEIEPWDLSILDAGMRELCSCGSGSGSGSGCAGGSGLKKILANGEPIAAPAPLDGDGCAIDDPTPSNAVFLPFEIYRKRAFALIEARFT